MTSIALFNNKGGVGKTTLVYHLAHMYQRLGARVLTVDLDPQSNLTSMFLDEDDLARLWNEAEQTFQFQQQKLFPTIRTDSTGTIAEAVRPITEGTGDVEFIRPAQINEGLWLLPGDLELSRFEDDLSQSWGLTFKGDPKALRAMTAFYRIIQSARREIDPDIILIDIGPNLGAINRAALLSSDTVLMPLAAELFSLRGLRNLGPTLREWRRDWKELVLPRAPEQIELPAGDMHPLGYVIMQPTVRLDRPVLAYQRWLERIPLVYDRYVLGNDPPSAKPDHEIATIRNYRSLMPLAHDARKPMFDLRPADGAMGSTQAYVQTCRSEFEELTRRIDTRLAAMASE
ncbi:chromosome partitioning protein [Nocardiopsis gilva YIM 90087]|uniref:Chromosome partitioning protein n=1 Tax=Nocardiopsis gilva YIM 90087 TaxID=1235441 RepID=A0A223S1Z6_9ACTN|nr:AAA family ATPase [Nocardiopsis gilva]ASU82039.1 chromosome partitioning protein [Nocardiopsis gilva YIM 90087]